MKISPGSQTLILAGEGRVQRPASAALPINTTLAHGPVLQRLTIVASQPDSSVVYLRADFAASPDRRALEPPAAAQPSASPDYRQTADPLRDGYAGSLTRSRDSGMSAYLRPVEQYARTQRILNDTPAREIDVHA